jgi:hypothetical protein
MVDDQDPDRDDHGYQGDEITTSRTKTLDDNPTLTCTVEQLAFAAWQKAAGAASFVESGPSWERFSAWWSAHATEFKTIRDVCAIAWAESSAHELEEWWRGIVISRSQLP